MAQETMTIEQRVAAVIMDRLGINESQITPDASLVYDLGADSLDVIEIIMLLEEEFTLEIPDEDAEGIQTVQGIITYIKKKLVASAI